MDQETMFQGTACTLEQVLQSRTDRQDRLSTNILRDNHMETGGGNGSCYGCFDLVSVCDRWCAYKPVGICGLLFWNLWGQSGSVEGTVIDSDVKRD